MAETKKTSSTTKKPTTRKKTTSTTKKPTTRKKTTSTTKKPSSTTKKTTTRKTPTKKTSSSSTKANVTKTSSPITSGSEAKKPHKKPTRKPKVEGRIKSKDELTTLETLEAQVEGKVIREKKPLGKIFYLVFSVVFYAIAFFYINSTVYAGGDLVQTAIFAFAALFIAFVLILFNIHMLVFNFFVLPFRRLFKQAKMETHKEIFFTVGKNKVQTTFNRYRSVFTIVLYFFFGAFLIAASILSSLTDGDTILKTVYTAILILLVYVVIINSWQFLFNIIPSILDKSIDAKNGYVLTLSAAVMVLYLVFDILNISYLSELMIFILVIGFIALLGVNLNMIIGEINIFQNLRGRKSKAVTRVVFVIFFGFQIYVILYASVVAYSIYNWEPDAYNFSEVHYDLNINDQLYSNGNLITQVYDINGNPINIVYNVYGDPLTTAIDADGNMITIYDQSGGMMFDYYDSTSANLFNITDAEGNPVSNYFFYQGRLARLEGRTEQLHTYGDLLYWTVITASTIG